MLTNKSTTGFSHVLHTIELKEMQEKVVWSLPNPILYSSLENMMLKCNKLFVLAVKQKLKTSEMFQLLSASALLFLETLVHEKIMEFEIQFSADSGIVMLLKGP